jgi:hypothetical protein
MLADHACAQLALVAVALDTGEGANAAGSSPSGGKCRQLNFVFDVS